MPDLRVLRRIGQDARFQVRQTFRAGQVHMYEAAWWAELNSAAAFVENAVHPSETLVSVITATRGRPHLLNRAIASIQRQWHSRWEHVVVDDSDAGDLPPLEHPNVRLIRTFGAGLARARNAGLDAANGTVVAYLDDDNMMHESWLRMLTWAFDSQPEAHWLYGARVVEEAQALSLRLSKRGPTLSFPSYNERALRRQNYIDVNALAHRNSNSIRFDPNTHTFSDWELVLRLAKAGAPLRVPGLACVYMTSHEDRMSKAPGVINELSYIVERHRGG